MKSRDLKSKLNKGQATIGSWMQIPDTNVAEIMGKAGYDWIAPDMEHGLINPEKMVELCRAIELGGSVPFVRLGFNDGHQTKQALEAGAKGIIAPMVNSKIDAENLIAWSHYTPHGKHGVGYSRANLFGKNFPDHIKNCDDDLVLVVQIEDIKAVQAIDEILAVPGIDALIVGPYDLSASMNLTGQFNHPDMMSAMNMIQQAARKANVAMGLHVVQIAPSILKAKIEEGYQFLAYATDGIFLFENSICPDLS